MAYGSETSKSTRGNFFEDFAVGQEILHATPRTATEATPPCTGADRPQFAVHCLATLARMADCRGPRSTISCLHLAFGRSVPDISLNAFADLGYPDGRFGALLYPGDTLTASSKVIGLKENSTGKAGTVYVRTRATKDDGREILEFVRWVMVAKRDPAKPGAGAAAAGAAGPRRRRRLTVPPGLQPRHFDRVLAARCTATTATRSASASITWKA